MPAYMYEITDRVHAALSAAAGNGLVTLVPEPADNDSIDDSIKLSVGGATVLTVQSGPYGVVLNEEGYERPGDDSSFWVREVLMSGGTSDANLSEFAALAIKAAIESPPAVPPVSGSTP